MTGKQPTQDMNQPPRIRQDTAGAERKGQPSMPELTAQARTASALLTLLTQYPDAPSLHWNVHRDDATALPTLVGQSCTDDAQDRAAVTTWAPLLGAEVVEEHIRSRRGETWTVVKADATVTGVRIEVWAMVDRVSAEEAAA